MKVKVCLWPHAVSISCRFTVPSDFSQLIQSIIGSLPVYHFKMMMIAQINTQQSAHSGHTQYSLRYIVKIISISYSGENKQQSLHSANTQYTDWWAGVSSRSRGSIKARLALSSTDTRQSWMALLTLLTCSTPTTEQRWFGVLRH